MNKNVNKLRVAVATPEIKVANCQHNAAQIIKLMEKAEVNQVHLLFLPELCITGSTCGGLFRHPTLQNSAKEALNKLVEASKNKNVMVVVGLPISSTTTGNNYEVYNTVAVFKQGQILGFMPKPSVHNSHFICNPEVEASSMRSILWEGGKIPFTANQIFAINGWKLNIYCPNPIHGLGFSATHAVENPTIIVNPSASPAFAGSTKQRRQTAEELSAKYQCVYVEANAGWGESTTDHAFSGHNIIANKGEILQESQPFGGGWAMAEITFNHTATNPPKQNNIPTGGTSPTLTQHPFVYQCQDPEEALNIQAAGLASRLKHTGSSAVIGISGGLDSCLALLVTIRAYALMGKPVSEIHAVTMPCFGTTQRTKSNAHLLCKALGVHCREIDIHSSVTKHLKDISHPEGVYDIVFENSQARMRTYILMDVANQVNGLVVGTGSLSELALGWATYNGDHMSMYAVNSGVPKTLVRHLVEYVAEDPQQRLLPCAKILHKYETPKPMASVELKKVLESILATKVSPELLPTLNGETTQITEDVVGPYELHDFFIFCHVQMCYRPANIFALAKTAFAEKYTAEEILHWLKTFYRRFFSQQFKRNCLPDGPQVVSISLSPRSGGLDMPSDAYVDEWLAELDGVTP